MWRPTSCGPSWPGRPATFVVNRNINFTNVCVVGCAFCGFGQGKRSPDAYNVAEEDFAARVEEAVDFGATEICMQGGIHPDYTLEDYGRWLQLAKEVAPRDPPARLLADGDPLHVRALGPAARRGLRVPDRVRARLDARNGGRGARRRRAPADLAEQAARSTAGSRSSRPPTAPGLRSTSTVMFGHIEEPRELAAPHAGRAASCRSGPAGSPSSSRSASSPSTRCSGARTGSRRSRAKTTSSTPPPSGWRSAGRSRTCRRAG